LDNLSATENLPDRRARVVVVVRVCVTALAALGLGML
jgi:hypothetical protein